MNRFWLILLAFMVGCDSGAQQEVPIEEFVVGKWFGVWELQEFRIDYWLIISEVDFDYITPYGRCLMWEGGQIVSQESSSRNTLTLRVQDFRTGRVRVVEIERVDGRLSISGFSGGADATMFEPSDISLEDQNWCPDLLGFRP